MTDAQRQAALSLLRTVLALAAGIAVGRGWVTTQQSVELSGALLVLIPAVWGYWNAFRAERETQKRETTAVQSGAIAAQRRDPEVAVPQVISPAMAQAVIETHAPA